MRSLATLKQWTDKELIFELQNPSCCQGDFAVIQAEAQVRILGRTAALIVTADAEKAPF